MTTECCTALVSSWGSETMGEEEGAWGGTGCDGVEEGGERTGGSCDS